MSSILVIRGGAIGDFILTLPAIGLLRENFPSARVEILGYRHIVAVAEGRYYAEASRSIEYGPLSRFFIPNAELDPELMEYFGGFNQIISYLFDPDGFFEANLRRCGVKNFIAGSPKMDDQEHAARQLARPMQRLALFLEDHAARIYPSEEDRAFADEFLQNVDRPILAVHPGSGSAKKSWPVERWREFLAKVREWEPKPALLVVSGEADQERVAMLGLKENRPDILVAAHLPLPQLAALLERARLFIGHDSGISHLAGAAGVRSLLLFGPTDPAIWAPANAGVEVMAAPDGEMECLGVGEMETRAKEMWGKEEN